VLGPVPNAVALRKVRLRSAERDGLRARRLLERALAGVDWTPSGLSPNAVLYVRKLALAGRGSAAARTSFGERVSLALRHQASQARRPWLHENAAAADAVLFADEAELVACLVRDWLRGRVADRWWWRSVLGDLSPQQWLRRQVLARGEILVPSIAILAAGPDAAAWLARLEDGEAEEAMAVIARTHAVSLTVAPDEYAAPRPSPPHDGHGLKGIEMDPRADSRSAALERLIATVPEILAPARRQSPSNDGHALKAIEIDSRTDSRSAALERLVATVPEILAPALRPPQRRLTALALALTRAPSWARTPQLAFALQGLDRTGLAADARAFAIPDAAQPRVPGLPAPRAATVTGVPPMGQMPVGSPDATDGAATAPEIEESRAGTQGRADIAHFGTRDPQQHAPPEVARRVVSSAPATQAETLKAAPSPKAEPVEAPSLADALRVRTQFGGIFYLLNAALALKLYGDFTAPRTPGLALSPWDWLALVGRAWFGEEFVRDPVWSVLAKLAGRSPKDAPERDFAPPPEWRIDPDWLVPWGECDALHVGVTRTRLRVLHAAGFVVFDVARDPAKRPLSQARALCATYDALRVLKFARTRAVRPRAPARTATARWLQWLLDYLCARLALALGADQLDDVPAILCRHPAEIAGTATGVHVHLALAGLPVALRIAGLDRDPGWIPAAGRTIAFHFE